MDRETHQRFLDYLDRREYFGATTPLLARDQFMTYDAEQLALESKGESRDDEEEARFNKLSKLLFRD